MIEFCAPNSLIYNKNESLSYLISMRMIEWPLQESEIELVRGLRISSWTWILRDFFHFCEEELLPVLTNLHRFTNELGCSRVDEANRDPKGLDPESANIHVDFIKGFIIWPYSNYVLEVTECSGKVQDFLSIIIILKNEGH